MTKLMIGLVAFAAAALAVLQVDVVVSANGKIVTANSEIVIQPVEMSDVDCSEGESSCRSFG